MNIEKAHLQDLNLKHKVFHPFLGEGKIVEIRESSLTVIFKHSTRKFETTGVIGETPFVTELYLKPVMVVAQAE